VHNIQKLATEVFGFRRGENIIILNDYPTAKKVSKAFDDRRDFARLWHKELTDLARKLNLYIEPIIFYEPTGEHGAELPVEAMQGNKKINIYEKMRRLGTKDIVIAFTEFSATGPLTNFAKRQKFRGASMPGVLEDMSALNAEPEKIAKRAKILATKLKNSRTAKVIFSTGHEMEFDFSNSKVEVDDGICKEPGTIINLPFGEAFITPNLGNGSKTQGYLPVFYDNYLVVYEVKEGKIIDVITDSPKSREMQRYFQEDPARGNIAEFGLGCNDKATFIGNILQDEKIEGMHWAYGYNDYMGGKIKASDFRYQAVHMDHIYNKEAKIKVNRIKLVYKDGKEEIIMENSRYSFNIQNEFSL
jgi:leucyl aminopeptidase (aminopeptidase T)